MENITREAVIHEAEDRKTGHKVSRRSKGEVKGAWKKRLEPQRPGGWYQSASSRTRRRSSRKGGGRERRRGWDTERQKNIFEKIMAREFQSLMKNDFKIWWKTPIHGPEILWDPARINPRKTTPWYIAVKLLKNKDKEKPVRAARRGGMRDTWGNDDKNNPSSHPRQRGPEDNRMPCVKCREKSLSA